MKNLRIRRKEKGHTCESLGNLVCVGKSTMAKYERGDIQPSKDILIKLAQILDCTTDYLLGLTNDPTPPTKKDSSTEIEKSEEYIKLLELADELEPDEIKVLIATAKALNSKQHK